MTGFYTALTSSVLFPIQERLKGHRSVSIRRQLERSQWWTRDQLMELQLQRLRSLLVDVGTHVPYYRHLFASLRFEPRDLSCLDELRQLPLLTKAEIRAHTEALKHENPTGLARFNTGGSSGEPGSVHVTIAVMWHMSDSGLRSPSTCRCGSSPPSLAAVIEFLKGAARLLRTARIQADREDCVCDAILEAH